MSKSQEDSFKGLEYLELIEIIKGNSRKKRKDGAYNEIESQIKPKIFFIVKQFFIPGCNYEDILQEALYALRYKAIPDYDASKGRDGIPYPFDKFAVLCVRRHLSTLLKSSFQNKRKALNTSLSLDQDRNTHSDENLYLSDIIPRTEGTIVRDLGDQEYYRNLFTKLYNELSILEQRVFRLYAKRYSYEEISAIINKYYKKNKIRKRTNVKSIDNSLSRIKQKAKFIFETYEKKEEDVEEK